MKLTIRIHNKAVFYLGLVLIIILLLTLPMFSQTITRSVRGTVFDAGVNVPLPGATIVVVDSHPLLGATTDENGVFELKKVPVGRVNLKISFIGYEDYNIQGLMISGTGKIEVEVPMKEMVAGLNEVVIENDFDKSRSQNKMATVSARSISLEEAQRFAGSMEDFSRLVASFAGASSSSIDNNEIIIRGNPAKGILWRLEGMEIPVPNHLAHAFNGGGVVSMFSPFMMSNSDFFTGAFPAEFGNVQSGVFDIKFRSGDPENRKYGLMIGSYGLEASAEGPFVKGKKGTYLANFRYSTFSILQNIMPVETGLPDYGDLSFALDFPTMNSGVFSVWSTTGYGKIEHKPTKEPYEWENTFDNIKYNIDYGLNATGLNHKYIVNNKTFVSSGISFSGTRNGNQSSQFNKSMNEVQVADIDERNYSIRLKSAISHKFGSRHTNKTGIILNAIGYNYHNKANTDPAIQDTLDFILDDRGFTSYYQLYSQSMIQLSNQLILNAGIHIMSFNLNGEFVIEPRLGFRWNIAPQHKLGLAYGKHSRLEPLRIYMMQVPTIKGMEQLNAGLKITKAHHLVLGYDWMINSNLHLCIEPYLQLLYDVPVSPDSSFSMINYQNDMFFTIQLNNSGSGINYGVDLTFERFIQNGFYYLFTGSVYQSKYKGGDGIGHNTRLNQNFIFNFLAGKEWQVRENNFLSINGKFTIAGGTRYTPPDQDASQEYQQVVYDYSQLYGVQWHTNYYVDLSINYRINRKKVAHNIILQAKNLTAQKELIGFAYNYHENYAEPMELAIVLPYLSYKINF